jgi:hypothetical protein
MTTQTDKPKRGPGRPRKNPLPEPPTPDPTPLDFKPVVLDVVREFGAPISASQVATLTEMEIPRVTGILDELVTDSDLALGDDQFYRLADAGAIEDIGEAAIEGKYDDSIIVEHRVASIPTSSIYAFLANLNLPPEYLEGLGAFHDLSGTIDYCPAEPTEDDPRPVCEFTISISGHHTAHFKHPNPNQRGYVAPMQAQSS